MEVPQIRSFWPCAPVCDSVVDREGDGAAGATGRIVADTVVLALVACSPKRLLVVAV